MNDHDQNSVNQSQGHSSGERVESPRAPERIFVVPGLDHGHFYSKRGRFATEEYVLAAKTNGLLRIVRLYRAALTWAVAHGKQPENCVMLNGTIRLWDDHLK